MYFVSAFSRFEEYRVAVMADCRFKPSAYPCRFCRCSSRPLSSMTLRYNQATHLELKPLLFLVDEPRNRKRPDYIANSKKQSYLLQANDARIRSHFAASHGKLVTFHHMPDRIDHLLCRAIGTFLSKKEVGCSFRTPPIASVNVTYVHR
jgi:hypothetical protein